MSLNDLLQAANAKGMFCMHPRSWGDDERMVSVVPEFLAREHSRQGHEQPPEQTVFFALRVVATSWPIQVGVFNFFFFVLMLI